MSPVSPQRTESVKVGSGSPRAAAGSGVAMLLTRSGTTVSRGAEVWDPTVAEWLLRVSPRRHGNGKLGACAVRPGPAPAGCPHASVLPASQAAEQLFLDSWSSLPHKRLQLESSGLLRPRLPPQMDVKSARPTSALPVAVPSPPMFDALRDLLVPAFLASSSTSLALPPKYCAGLTTSLLPSPGCHPLPVT